MESSADTNCRVAELAWVLSALIGNFNNSELFNTNTALTRSTVTGLCYRLHGIILMDYSCRWQEFLIPGNSQHITMLLLSNYSALDMRSWKYREYNQFFSKLFYHHWMSLLCQQQGTVAHPLMAIFGLCLSCLVFNPFCQVHLQ